MKLDIEKILKELKKVGRNKVWLANQIGCSRQALNYILKIGPEKAAVKIAPVFGLGREDLIIYSSKMRNYLSFGGGVNSVALHLYLLDQGWKFESTFVDHGTDWPETYEYLEYFQEWLYKNNHAPIISLIPNESPSSLYDYCWEKKILPNRNQRWCTSRFKINRLFQYYERPAFELIGFDYGEIGRVSIQTRRNTELRYPLIEAEMDRGDCLSYIKQKGLKQPDKSGCFICPFQNESRWWELRQKHSDLYCKALDLEKRCAKDSKMKGRKVYYLRGDGLGNSKPSLFKEDNPPCVCEL